MDASAPAPAATRPPLYQQLYVQVLLAIVLGAVFGALAPHIATANWVKALGDGFVKLIKMVIAPIIFLTVTAGIAHVADARKVGRVAIKALVYFDVVSTFALAIGLIVGNLIRPGAGLAAHANAAAVANYAKAVGAERPLDYILNIIPDSVIGAFARGDILQVLLFSILFGFALMALGQRGKLLTDVLDQATHAIFGVINIVMRAAPFGAFGAMAYTVGKYGAQALGALAGEIATFYLTSAIFVVLVLGTIGRVAGFNIFKFLAYLKDELLIVLGTSSSESAFPRLIEKLEALGCSQSVVGLVVPAGYSFNLDGTNIYMTLATCSLPMRSASTCRSASN
jgi:aerobic C4-dicarboxylate transport protein